MKLCIIRTNEVEYLSLNSTQGVRSGQKRAEKSYFDFFSEREPYTLFAIADNFFAKLGQL